MTARRRTSNPRRVTRNAPPEHDSEERACDMFMADDRFDLTCKAPGCGRPRYEHGMDAMDLFFKHQNDQVMVRVLDPYQTRGDGG